MLNRIKKSLMKRIALFDVDGTLTPARQGISQQMINKLKQLKTVADVGIVGGSDLKKIKEQVGQEVIDSVDFVFSENGLYSLKQGQLFHQQSFKDYLGEERLQQLLNYTLLQLSQIVIPIKRGTFIEYRTGMLNISPIGRNCSQEERDDFEKYDKQHQVRKALIEKLQAQFPWDLKYSIGGQISFDVFPQGWDKTYCLQFLGQYDEIYFFGDKTFEGGNDYEIFEHQSTKGFTVDRPETTIEFIDKLFINQ